MHAADYAVPVLLTLLAGVVLAAFGHLPPWPVFAWLVVGAFLWLVVEGGV